MSRPSVDVVIPVRTMAEDLRQCLSTLTPQLGPLDRVIVVDDGSADETAEIARTAGATVIQLTTSQGPYFARHQAATKSHADVLLFIDGRCRPGPGLIQAHADLQSDPSVNLSCSPIDIVQDGSLLTKVVAAAGLYDLAGKVGDPTHLDYFPTANLGVRRTAYLAVGGFRDVSSGGDVDLCWRIQTALGPCLRARGESLLAWSPRGTWRETVQQWQKYGRSHARLISLYPDSDPHPDGLSLTSRVVSFVGFLFRQVRGGARDPRVVLSLAVLNAFRLVAFRRALAQVTLQTEPQPFGRG